MEREKALYAAEVMKAYAEGKEIESRDRDGDSFYSIDPDPIFDWDGEDYRIKSESKPKYRAFKDNAECITEMQKHKPFGWVRYKKNNKELYNIVSLTICDVNLLGNCPFLQSYGDMLNSCEFLDGTPFGIKE